MQITRNKTHPSLCYILLLWKSVRWSGYEALQPEIIHLSWPVLRHIATLLSQLLSWELCEEADNEGADLWDVFSLTTFCYPVSKLKPAKTLTSSKTLRPSWLIGLEEYSLFCNFHIQKQLKS